VDQELQEKIQKFDESIRLQFDLYQQLGDLELHEKRYWSNAGKDREKQIFDEITNLQNAKIRLINNEKLPETIYVDREVVKYKDRIIKRVVVHKSGLANSFVWFSFLISSLLYILYFFGYLHVYFTLK
jgi:hypothetical protein